MEKIIIIPFLYTNTISAEDIDKSVNGIISVWNNSGLQIGFVYYDKEDAGWVLVKGTEPMDAESELLYLMENFPQYIFKLNTFD